MLCWLNNEDSKHWCEAVFLVCQSILRIVSRFGIRLHLQVLRSLPMMDQRPSNLAGKKDVGFGMGFWLVDSLSRPQSPILALKSKKVRLDSQWNGVDRMMLLMFPSLTFDSQPFFLSYVFGRLEVPTGKKISRDSSTKRVVLTTPTPTPRWLPRQLSVTPCL